MGKNDTKVIASYFENNIADSARWHSALLQRMGTEIPGVRPALISGPTFQHLNPLREFRHFFRHAYVSVVELEPLKANVEHARQAYQLLQSDVIAFLEQLDVESK